MIAQSSPSDENVEAVALLLDRLTEIVAEAAIAAQKRHRKPAEETGRLNMQCAAICALMLN